MRANLCHLGLRCLLFLLAILIPIPALAADLSEYEKEMITALKEMTNYLLYFAAGIFALMMTNKLWEAAPTKLFRRVLIASLSCLGLSLLGGLFVFMALVDQLRRQQLLLTDPFLLYPSNVQFWFGLVGVVLFAICLVRKIVLWQ